MFDSGSVWNKSILNEEPTIVQNKFNARNDFVALSDSYPMFIEPTITRVPSWFSGYIWLDTKKLCYKTWKNSLETWKIPPEKKQAYYKNSHKKLHIKTNVYNLQIGYVFNNNE